MTRFLAVLCVKNEGAFLLDWLAHHKAVGFTDFLVFSNDCQDGTDKILDELASENLIAHVRNDGPHRGGVQWSAMKLADNHALTNSADWIMALDIDEFVNIHCGAHRLADLVEHLPQADAITLTWRLFGNNDVDEFVDAPITGQFTGAAPKVLHWPWRAAMFKTLYRNNGIYRKIGIHRPKSPDPDRVDQANWYDGSGRLLPDVFRKKQIFSIYGRDNYQLAQLNHYALGAKQSYVLKADRGRGVHADDTLGMSYWMERNWVDEEDSSILRLADEVARVKDKLARIGNVKSLHENAVFWRKSRFLELMKEEGPRALYGRLLMSRPAKSLSIEQARTLYKFHDGAKTETD